MSGVDFSFSAFDNGSVNFNAGYSADEKVTKSHV